ncbi:MAG TPA: nuclear transport factor 2 family protein [Pyrinomonadaceae bacterium]|jgi:ketosteroid isomerase-like protein|nr:nuclear transport factor 2 family protein [Pyrinomonadaceae bacterium]
MFKKLFIAAALALSCAISTVAQNTNNPTNAAPQPTPVRRPGARRPAPLPTPVTLETQETTPTTPDTAAPASRTRRAAGAPQTTAAAGATPAERAVRATFDTLLNGIRKSDVEMVMSVYWNSPQLVIFNNNGTVTRTWEQVRANRASAYPDAKNVQLEVRDVRVSMLGAGGAVVSCLWTQTQEFRGTPESANGRLTVVFRLINNGWKIVHTHSSPSAPDPSRLLPSEQPAAPPASDATKPPPRIQP